MKNNLLSLRAVLLSFLLLTGMAAFAQVSVRGTVTDAANGEPIIGASVLEIGTTNGTITDFDGNFELKVQSGAKLSISYMGYKTQELDASPSMNVRLGEDSELLDEVVVVGYGVVKKNDATGAVTAIKPDDMNKGLNTTATDMLSGKIAGVNVTSSGGAPGAGATIRIRGGSSLAASNDPLIIIDGLAMDNNGIQGVSNPLSLVNPADIETFTVLKDASATAIYGSRASNGVIIITTKKGAQGSKPKFSYEGNVSMANLVNRLETLTGDDIRKYASDLGHSSSKTKWLGVYNTDWQDQIYRAAISTDHNFSVTGGLKNMPYRFSVGYTLLNGIVKTNSMQRVTASMNLNPSFLDKHLVFNLNAKGMYIYNHYAAGVVGAALSMDPTQPVKGGNPYRYDGSEPTIKGAGGVTMTETEIANNYFGGYYQRATRANYGDPAWPYTVNRNTTGNPVAALEQETYLANSGSFVGNLEGDYKIHGFEDLHLHANFGADYSYGKSTTDISPYSFSNHYYGWQGWEETRKYNLLFTAYAQYAHDWEEGGGHHFDIMAAYEWQHFYRDGSRDGWGSYPANSQLSDGTANPKAGQMKDDTRSQYRWMTENYLVSFFGRLNWTGWNQLMITATFRADGSSRFHKNNRWGFFPSAALGWKIKESFAALRDNNTVSELKLRLNYGITGQQEIGQGDYPYFATYYVSQPHAYYPVGGDNLLYLDADGKVVYDGSGTQVVDGDGLALYYHYRPDAVNTELTWEKTTTYGAGIDYGFLNSRITGSIDYYYRVTNDLINVVNVPAGANFRNKVVSNIGSLYNQGIEFSINAVAIDMAKDPSKFKWDLGFNFTWNENKITKLNQATNDSTYYVPTGGISVGTGGTIQAHKVGYAASTFYVYKTEKGVDENGNPMYYAVDLNKDGQVNGEDRYMHKSPMAPITLGFQTKFQFYNFDLGLTLRASIGNYVYNGVLAGGIYNVAPDNVYTNLQGGYCGLTRIAYNTYWTGMKSDGMSAMIWDKATNAYVAGDPFSDWFLTDYFVEDASFLRCDNITLGYTFDEKVTKNKLHARIYATVQNPFVISAYKGLDPEIFGGIDNNIYPRSMTTVLGVSLQF
ncbi:MAG: SusC/RagA family TonB-linked outer membrane protein [Paludibacteraceae bacterium]|nr:SusC/RagA family TonB-linked outer membrane protein [Paludibacteraceae bacterium]